MRISARLAATVSLLAIAASATPAWAASPSPTDPGSPGSSSSAPSGSPASSGASGHSASPTSGPTATSGGPASSTTPSAGSPATSSTKVAPRAAYPVEGAIANKWAQVKDVVGDPTGPMHSITGGYWQQFAKGVITSSSAGTHDLYGNVYAKWAQQSDQVKWSWLGFPAADGGDDVVFQKGRIIHNSGRDAAYMIGGSIYTAFNAAGGISAVGLPTSDEVAGRGGGVGRINWFESGAIAAVNASSGGGTYAIRGVIYRKWAGAGGELSSYGAPAGNQVKSGSTFDQRFVNRNSVLSYTTGQVIEVSGAIGAEYVRRGMAGSDLRQPLSAMRAVSGGYQQTFYNGDIKYAGGIRIVVNPRISSHTTTAAETRYTYRSGCPVAPSQLTTTQLNYYNFDGKIARGVIITRTGAVTSNVQAAFTQADQSAFPIRQILNPDYYKGDDPTQMNYDNTSAFNCRKVTGNPYSTSPHSYGVAVDINTFENPYQDSNGKWWPTRDGAAYWRTHRTGKGVLTGSDVMTKALTSRGAFWGARWSNPDYQHFEWD